MSAELSDLLFNAINEQGYLFQEACKHALEKNEQGTGWEVKASEYPVSIAGEETKVDIVLRAKRQSPPEIYALVECKRADPSYIRWLFGAPGLPFGGALCSTLGFKSKTAPRLHVKRFVTRIQFQIQTHGVENWLEVKKNPSKRVSTPQNIESAFIQVLKGVGGFAQEQLHQRRKEDVPIDGVFFVPVVVTTAKLYAAYYEIKDIDLATGKISKGKVQFGSKQEPAMEKPWVLLDYGVGENIAPEPIPKEYHGVDPAEMHKHKIRSIFVVNSKELVNFFSKLRLAQ